MLARPHHIHPCQALNMYPIVDESGERLRPERNIYRFAPHVILVDSRTDPQHPCEELRGHSHLAPHLLVVAL